MLLKWHQGGDADELCDLDYTYPALQVLGNPKKELAQLRAITGGLELGAKTWQAMASHTLSYVLLGK